MPWTGVSRLLFLLWRATDKSCYKNHQSVGPGFLWTAMLYGTQLCQHQFWVYWDTQLWLEQCNTSTAQERPGENRRLRIPWNKCKKIDRVFHIWKYREHDIHRGIFHKFWGIFKCGETLPLLFDRISQSQRRADKFKSRLTKIRYPNTFTVKIYEMLISSRIYCRKNLGKEVIFNIQQIKRKHYKCLRQVKWEHIYSTFTSD